MPQRDKPLAVTAREERRQVLTAVNDAAAAERLTPGMPLAHARAILPDLALLRADPQGDQAALHRLGLWARRFTPVVGMSGSDGLALDVTGCAHLFGGEKALLSLIAKRLRVMSISARLALAETAGAGWGLARFGARPVILVEPGRTKAAIAGLPLLALRLPLPTALAFKRLGFLHLGELYDIPRATIARRFGAEVERRLDEALGLVAEPLTPLPEPEPIARILNFVEPIGTTEQLNKALSDGVALICEDLAADHLGLRRLALRFNRVDGKAQTIAIGTARPSRNAAHLVKLLSEKLGTVDPGFGVERAVVIAPVVEPLPPSQTTALAEIRERTDLSPLVDRLVNRMGEGRVYRLRPRESDIPERAVARVLLETDDEGADCPRHWPRPLRLLSPPEPVTTMALLPDHPPVQFIWRGMRHRVRAADGPERIFGEWWRRKEEVEEIRDYFRVENEAGERFWIFRRTAAKTRWFMHGIFA